MRSGAAATSCRAASRSCHARGGRERARRFPSPGCSRRDKAGTSRPGGAREASGKSSKHPARTGTAEAMHTAPVPPVALRHAASLRVGSAAGIFKSAASRWPGFTSPGGQTGLPSHTSEIPSRTGISVGASRDAAQDGDGPRHFPCPDAGTASSFLPYRLKDSNFLRTFTHNSPEFSTLCG